MCGRSCTNCWNSNCCTDKLGAVSWRTRSGSRTRAPIPPFLLTLSFYLTHLSPHSPHAFIHLAHPPFTSHTLSPHSSYTPSHLTHLTLIHLTPVIHHTLSL